MDKIIGCHWCMHEMIHFFWIATWSYLGRRVQLSRRMDQAALEVAASRQAAETAIAQVEYCRMPRHSFVFLFQKGPSDPSRWYQNISERYQVIDRFDAIWACFYGAKVAALRAELASIIGQNWRGGQAKDSSRRPPGQSRNTNSTGKSCCIGLSIWLSFEGQLVFFLRMAMTRNSSSNSERLATGRSSYLIWWLSDGPLM